jgi:transcriptional regulator with XRE-family HTH domain
MKIAKLILKERISQNLTRETLVHFAQLKNTKTLVDYETAKKTIPLKELYAIANVLNIPPTKILKIINKHNKIKPLKQNL